jgi:hypothetical protein
MATNVGLNGAEGWRSVVRYRRRVRNPEATFDNRFTVPRYLDEWSEYVFSDVRGPYDNPGEAKRQASRDASDREKERAWQGPGGSDRITLCQVVSVTIERTAFAWEEVDRRDPAKGWGG